jgi:hypothetical protein
MSLINPVSFDGQGGNVIIDALQFSVLEWKVKFGGDKLDTTSTGDGGFKTSIVGPLEGEGTFKICADVQVFAPLLLPPNSVGVAATLFLGISPFAFQGAVNILSWDITNPAEAVVELECAFVTSGAFTITT